MLLRHTTKHLQVPYLLDHKLKIGTQKEFEAIIAAVIGGCFLMGGYGSAIGALIGAIIFGIVKIGLAYTSFDLDNFLIFLGAMLLVAVFFNNFIRRFVTREG